MDSSRVMPAPNLPSQQMPWARAVQAGIETQSAAAQAAVDSGALFLQQSRSIVQSATSALEQVSEAVSQATNTVLVEATTSFTFVAANTDYTVSIDLTVPNFANSAQIVLYNTNNVYSTTDSARPVVTAQPFVGGRSGIRQQTTLSNVYGFGNLTVSPGTLTVGVRYRTTNLSLVAYKKGVVRLDVLAYFYSAGNIDA